MVLVLLYGTVAGGQEGSTRTHTVRYSDENNIQILKQATKCTCMEAQSGERKSIFCKETSD